MNTDRLNSIKKDVKTCLVYLLISSEDESEGGEQRGQSFGDQSRDEQEEVLGGTTGVWQWQRAKSPHKPTGTKLKVAPKANSSLHPVGGVWGTSGSGQLLSSYLLPPLWINTLKVNGDAAGKIILVSSF